MILQCLLLVGVTRFELAASASLRRRSNQTEPHPENQQLKNRINTVPSYMQFPKNARENYIFFIYFRVRNMI